MGAETISVVVATYNAGPVLEEQLASIAAQTRLPTEVIISDDGSQDDSVDVARGFAASAPFPVKVLTHPEPRTTTVNVLDTLRHATCDLVALSDQDDVWFPGKLATCASAFTPDTTMVVHSSRRVTYAGEHLQRRGLRTGLITRWDRNSPLHTPLGSHLLLRRSILERLPPEQGPRSVSGMAVQTHDEWAYYAARVLGRVVFLDAELMLYRRQDGRDYIFLEDASPLAKLNPASSSQPANARPHLRAMACTSRAQHLRAQTPVDPADAAAMQRWAGLYERLAGHEMRRATALVQPPGRAMAGLAQAALKGAYGRQAAGGCGPLAAARDGLQLLSSSRTA